MLTLGTYILIVGTNFSTFGTCLLTFGTYLLIHRLCGGCTQWVMWCQGSIWIITRPAWWPLTSTRPLYFHTFILVILNVIFWPFMRSTIKKLCHRGFDCPLNSGDSTCKTLFWLGSRIFVRTKNMWACFVYQPILQRENNTRISDEQCFVMSALV